MGDLHVGYKTRGTGPLNFVWVPNWATNIEALDDLPEFSHHMKLLTRIGRVTIFDQPGTGISDPVALDALPTLEQWIDSTKAVMDEAGIERAALFAIDSGGLTAILFAATYPERTSALILFGSWARA